MKTSLLISILIMLIFTVHGQEEVLNFTVLQSYLPQNIPGYEAGEPDGQTTSMQGLSFSSANIEFTRTDVEYVKISLLDYSEANSMYQATAATWSAGMTFENDEVSVKQVTWNDNISGWKQYDKKDKISIIALGISDRFFLTIEANNQNNTDLVVSIAREMDLDQLASL